MSRRRRPSRSALVLRWLAVGGLLAIALAYVHPIRSYLRAREEVSARRAEVVELVREKRRLTRKVALAETDAFVEREARKLGLVRPGERLFIVTGLKESEKAGLR